MPIGLKTSVPRVVRVPLVPPAVFKASQKMGKLQISFRLLSGLGSAIICLVSSKEILGTLIFDIGGSRKIAAAGPKGQNLLPPWHNVHSSG